MSNNKINATTLDDLATMVAKGFEQNADDLNNLKSELGEVRREVGTLKFKVDDIYEILARFEEGDILDLQKRIKILERTVKAMAQHLNKQ